MRKLVDEAEDRGYRYMASRIHPGLSDVTTNQCAQAVLLVTQELFMPDISDTMVQAVGSLAGGRCVSLCGAFISGMLAVGARYGPSKSELTSTDAFLRGVAKIQEFCKRFEGEFGSRYCITLSGYDLNDPVARQKFLTEGYEPCCKLVGKTCRIIGEILTP